MEFSEFTKYAGEFNTVPIIKKYSSDMITPVAAYLKLRDKSTNTFLLESVEGIGNSARYSFIGIEPETVVSAYGNEVSEYSNGSSKNLGMNIYDYLNKFTKEHNYPDLNNLPPLSGGMVGYLGFETIALIEDKLQFEIPNRLKVPDAVFGLYKTIIAFDHYKQLYYIIINTSINSNDNLNELYSNSLSKIDSLHKTLQQPLEYNAPFDFEYITDTSDNNKFYNIVEKAKEKIYNGDVFQLVLSKRFSATFTGDQFNVYRALRAVNPSPYMYFMEFDDDLNIIGTSPEDLLTVKEKKATILPIAGTRKRGKDSLEDKELENDLLNDPKELAEHVMLVDLARNDLGRICELNSVNVTENKNIHYFSHVMHIVSRVEGKLKEGYSAIDALKAAFPAGTVSGAPKIRAMELIKDYEQEYRNIYAGAIGYLDFRGNLDLCIAIRTLFSHKEKIYWQAGAGIVADSIPENEYNEILNKSAVLKKALEYARGLNENIDD